MLKVLIAEDEPLSLQNLSGQMRDLLGADALIEGVANGREAVERARQIQPQLVLMDIEMPVMNGLDAAAIIHKAMPCDWARWIIWSSRLTAHRLPPACAS